MGNLVRGSFAAGVAVALLLTTAVFAVFGMDSGDYLQALATLAVFLTMVGSYALGYWAGVEDAR